MQTERRSSPRKTFLKRARIELAGGHCSLACVLLDMSRDGARIRSDEWLMMPDRFELRFEDGNKRTARVCYRGMGVAGVRFTDVVPTNAGPADA